VYLGVAIGSDQNVVESNVRDLRIHHGWENKDDRERGHHHPHGGRDQARKNDDSLHRLRLLT
jgi:hypothetical protein